MALQSSNPPQKAHVVLLTLAQVNGIIVDGQDLVTVSMDDSIMVSPAVGGEWGYVTRVWVGGLFALESASLWGRRRHARVP